MEAGDSMDEQLEECMLGGNPGSSTAQRGESVDPSCT